MSPTNLNKEFDEFLDIIGKSPDDAMASLRLIFNRDMINFPCKEFNGRVMVYTRDPLDAERQLNHLVKKKINGERKYIDNERAKRLHWVKYFLENALKRNKYWVFSYKHPKEGIRTYIYHKNLKFIVILEPNIDKNEYYLITAYYVLGTGIEDIKDLYAQKLPNII